MSENLLRFHVTELKEKNLTFFSVFQEQFEPFLNILNC